VSQQLSLSARPRSFDAMIGQNMAKIVAAIRGHYTSGRTVKAWMFAGPKGTGKTTLARILALSYQCQHQKGFGIPCRECNRRKSAFQIAEINAADVTGIDGLRDALSGSDYGTMGESRYKVYILDECFAPGTLVSVIGPSGVVQCPIEKVSAGSAIVSAYGRDRVQSVSRKKIETAVKVSYAGQSVICSTGHPFFTARGWVSASSLSPGDILVSQEKAMLLLRGAITTSQKEAILQQALLREVSPLDKCTEAGTVTKDVQVVSRTTTCTGRCGLVPLREDTILQQLVRQTVVLSTAAKQRGHASAFSSMQSDEEDLRAYQVCRIIQEDHSQEKTTCCCRDSKASGILCTVQCPASAKEALGANNQQVLQSFLCGRLCYATAGQTRSCQPTYEREQSGSVALGTNGYFSEIEGQTFYRSEGRQWDANDPTTDTFQCFGQEVASRIHDWLGEKATRVSDQVYGRSGVAREEDCNRSRRAGTSILQGADQRSKEGCDTDFIRVDSVTFLEPGDPELERFRQTDGFIYFYDLAIERHPSFVINGALVHNCQGFSKSAQSLLLKYLEDSPDTTIFILCTTAPQQVIDTLRSRCAVYTFRELESDDIEAMVTMLLKKAKSGLPADRLVDAINERGVRSPRLICWAVEKYVAGVPPDEAVQVEGCTELDIHALCRTMIKGDWAGVSTYLKNAETLDARAIRSSLLAYLRTVLVEQPTLCERSSAVSKAISRLCSVENAGDLVMSASLSAELYQLTAIFARYKL
jgi:DNA polymerase III gamma/tau subunit